MIAPQWFDRELELINQYYFSVYDDLIGRWRIRKWKSVHPINHKLYNWKWDSKQIMTVKLEDNEGRDIGYLPLDMSIIHSMKRGFYNARHVRDLISQIDTSNENIEKSFDVDTEDIGRIMAMDVWRGLKSHTVDLGAN